MKLETLKILRDIKKEVEAMSFEELVEKLVSFDKKYTIEYNFCILEGEEEIRDSLHHLWRLLYMNVEVYSSFGENNIPERVLNVWGSYLDIYGDGEEEEREFESLLDEEEVRKIVYRHLAVKKGISPSQATWAWYNLL